MSDRARDRFILTILLIISTVVFATGINWGLPRRAADAYLFGSHPAWTADQIAALAPAWSDSDRGADVDVNPILDRTRTIDLNDTDSQRAEILRRYRLFSAQPDEMITFRALAGMQPGNLKLDPKLYQYGGLWIYPIGALLKIAANPRADISYYLDHPQEFGRFYIVARLYSAAWGVLGAFAIFWIIRRMTNSLIGAITAALCYIFMPVVVNMAHEAKPHLAGAVLILLAVIAAMKFLETWKRRWWVITGALCGAAAGMVLSAAIAIVIIPTMALITPLPWRRRLGVALGAGLVAIAVYFATNPYVAINLFRDRDVVRSNLANSAAMYEVGRWREGFVNAVLLMREGASLPLLMAGVAAAIAILLFPSIRKQATLLLVPVFAVLIQFVALAAGKPGEYGRFALLPDIVLAIFCGVAIGTCVRRDIDQIKVATLLLVLVAVPSWFYLAGFARDASSNPTRLEGAAAIETLRAQGGARTLAVFAEPAPYSLPPVNLFEWRIILMPRGADIAEAVKHADVVIRPVDALTPGQAQLGDHIRTTLNRPPDRFPTRISWAAKSFEVWVKREVLDRAAARASSP